MTAARHRSRGVKHRAERSSPVVGSAAALLVAAAAALALTLPEAPRVGVAGAVPEAAPVEEPVARAMLTCPPGSSDAVVRVGSAPALPRLGDGPIGPTVAQAGETRTVELERGELDTVGVARPAVSVRATGAAARGLLATRAVQGPSRLSVARCLGARPVWWFSGAGAGLDHASVLFLTNPDEEPALVDVRLHGAAGSVDRTGTRGLTVPDGETLRLPLAEVAPGSGELAVEVVSARGRVVGHVFDTLRRADGVIAGWLPAAPPPAEDLVLPGVPAGADRVQVVVTNPGAEQALVDLELLTEDGAFVPLGDEQLSVDPGSTKRLDLTDALEGRAGAVHLDAQLPVTGAVRTLVKRGNDPVVVHAGAVAPLTGASGVVLVGERSELHVASGDEPVSLQLSLHAANGSRLLRRTVSVPPSGFRRIRLPARGAYAVLLPRAGGGYASAVHTGAGMAGQPVTLLPTTVSRPSVVPYAGQSPS